MSHCAPLKEPGFFPSEALIRETLNAETKHMGLSKIEFRTGLALFNLTFVFGKERSPPLHSYKGKAEKSYKLPEGPHLCRMDFGLHYPAEGKVFLAAVRLNYDGCKGKEIKAFGAKEHATMTLKLPPGDKIVAAKVDTFWDDPVKIIFLVWAPSDCQQKCQD